MEDEPIFGGKDIVSGQSSKFELLLQMIQELLLESRATSSLKSQEGKDQTSFPSSKLNMPSPSKLQSPMASRQCMHSRQEGNFTSINAVTKPFISNSFSNKNDTNPRTHNDKQSVQYHNPHQRKLNVLSKNNNEYNDDNDEYNDDYDGYNDDCYDIDKVFGVRNDCIEGHNPGYNITNTLSSIDKEMTKLPCHAELPGKYPSQSTCKYSHDIKLLQKTWSEKLEELNKSKYRPSLTHLPRANTPLKPLRSITTEEGGQVSIFEDNNTNVLLHYLDRNSTVSSGDQRPIKALLEPSKGVQFLNGPGDSVEAEFPRYIWDPGKINSICSFYILCSLIQNLHIYKQKIFILGHMHIDT
jgi:hypothetical protein